MSIKQQILDDLKAAMKARDKERVGVLRMVRAKMQEAEVAARADRGVDYELEDEGATQVLSSYAKQRRDSIESYEKGGRDDLAAKERAELAIVQGYLPEQLGEAEIEAFVREAIAESGATSPKQMGVVMQAAMPRVEGRADGKAVSRIVRRLLQEASPTGTA